MALPQPARHTVTIANTAQLSGALKIGASCVVAVDTPAALTGTRLSFQGSVDGVAYLDIYRGDGTLYVVAVAPDRTVPVDGALFRAYAWVKVKSGSAEGGARVIGVATHPDPVAGAALAGTLGAAATAVALVTPPATLTAGANTALTFAATVYAIYVENNTTEDKHYAAPSPATAGSKLVPAGGSVTLPIPAGTTTVGIYGASASNLNGATGSNLILEGVA